MHAALTNRALVALALAGCGPRGAVPIDAQTIPPVLLFDGSGVSPNDVTAVEAILADLHLSFTTVDSAQLDGMSDARLKSYRLLIVPGGNFIEMGAGLRKNSARIRETVQGGVGYLGICAGAFLAGDSAYYNGFNLTSGVKFGFFADEARGIRKEAVAVTRADGPRRPRAGDEA
jgi:glutamine amidotransferase-like uncharacterized protein